MFIAAAKNAYGSKMSWDLGLKKLFDWRNPTDPIFTPYPKYIFFGAISFFFKTLKTNIFI